jgi:hypothetical protein
MLDGYVRPDRNPRCPPRGDTTVNPHAEVNGTPAIGVTSGAASSGPGWRISGEYSYWVRASDYRPLQFEDRRGWLGRSPIERLLTGAAASPSLVSLHAQHPRATIDESFTDYQAFQRQIAP